MNKKQFKDIFPDYSTWNTLILGPINIRESNPIYLNDSDFKYSQNTIYEMLLEQYGNYYHNQNTDSLFIQTVKQVFMDNMMRFYINVNSFNRLELNTINEDFFRTFSKSFNSGNQSSTGTTENRASDTPLDNKISSILDNLPMTNAVRQNAERILRNEQEARAYLENQYDVFKNMQTQKVSNFTNIFINSFSYLFVNIVDSRTEDKDINYIRFADGTILSEVNYYGEQNLRNIEKNKSNISANNLEIQRIKNVLPNDFDSRKVWIVENGIGKFVFLNDVPIRFFKGLTREEIIGLITSAFLTWQPSIPYRQGVIVNEIIQSGNKKLAKRYVSLIRDNLNNDPKTSPEAWEPIAETPIDITALYPYINDQVQKEVQDQLNDLPVVDISSFVLKSSNNIFTNYNTFTQKVVMNNGLAINNKKLEFVAPGTAQTDGVNFGQLDSQRVTLNSNIETAKNNAILTSNNYTDQEIGKIPSPDLGNYVDKNTAQTITGFKTMNNLKLGGGLNANEYRIVNLSPGINGLDAVNVNQLRGKADQGAVVTITNTQTVTGTKAFNDIRISATGTFDANNRRIINVPSPTGAQHAANKAYVDNSKMRRLQITVTIGTGQTYIFNKPTVVLGARSGTDVFYPYTTTQDFKTWVFLGAAGKSTTITYMEV